MSLASGWWLGLGLWARTSPLLRVARLDFSRGLRAAGHFAWQLAFPRVRTAEASRASSSVSPELAQGPFYHILQVQAGPGSRLEIQEAGSAGEIEYGRCGPLTATKVPVHEILVILSRGSGGWQWVLKGTEQSVWHRVSAHACLGHRRHLRMYHHHHRHHHQECGFLRTDLITRLFAFPVPFFFLQENVPRFQNNPFNKIVNITDLQI